MSGFRKLTSLRNLILEIFFKAFEKASHWIRILFKFLLEQQMLTVYFTISLFQLLTLNKMKMACIIFYSEKFGLFCDFYLSYFVPVKINIGE